MAIGDWQEASGQVSNEPSSNIPATGQSSLTALSQSQISLPIRSLDTPREIEPRIARMEAEMDAARKRGVLGLMRLRYEAWLEEKMKGPAIAKMQARQALLEEQRKTAEAEIRLKVTVQSGEVGAQRHRIEWNEVNRQRLAGELHALGMITLSPGSAPAVPASSFASSPPVSTHVTDEQVEAVALRGFLKGVETEEDWLVYRAELGQHLPPYTVEEVGSRLRELWRLNRQAGAGA